MSEGDRDVELEGQRKQVLADVLEVLIFSKAIRGAHTGNLAILLPTNC